MENKSLYLKLFKMNDNEKIMYIIEHVFGAVSPETAVTIREVIDLGIENELTEPYPRTGDDGHPWWPRTSVMMGVGSVEAVEANEEPYLHRAILSNIKGKPYGYWVDHSHKHEISSRSEKSESVQVVSRRISKRKEYVVETCDNMNILTMAKKVLNRRNIPFILETKKGCSVLTVQIVGEKFFSVPLTDNDAERTLGLMSYAIHRPDRASEEIPGIKMFKNFALEAKWKELTAENL